MTELLEKSNATGRAKEVYDDIDASFGMIPNLFKAMASADPEWLALNWQREKQIMIEDGPLDRKTRELIALAVSITNNCKYCSLAHEALALHSGASREMVAHTKQIIELFSSFNAIANSFPELPCDIKPKK
ncbi:MAG: carboxymuconolactone decarboxylase family protein [Burkholderiales bacterium]|nr:carboxymuconolactone decarboxylase family protein [Burkholderiales bacterium]MDR4516914.1 carboxymuconolactone decarboxylase family protein [Nitrosomonas sp.]